MPPRMKKPQAANIPRAVIHVQLVIFVIHYNQFLYRVSAGRLVHCNTSNEHLSVWSCFLLFAGLFPQLAGNVLNGNPVFSCTCRLSPSRSHSNFICYFITQVISKKTTEPWTSPHSVSNSPTGYVLTLVFFQTVCPLLVLNMFQEKVFKV